jgi:myo-inositol-1(or 4)-monophosphatase
LPGPDGDPTEDLALLTGAAHAAGEIARARIGRVAVWEKPGGEGPVTEADIEIDAMLRARLGAARPGYGWLSEESADDPARLAARRVFIVDPIDGTRAFAAGEHSFAHSLAIAVDGRVVAGVVHLPMRGETYAAFEGGGARLNDVTIRPSDRRELAGAEVLAAGTQLRADLWPGGVPQVTRHFRPSLAWRLCLAAAGRYDAALTLREAWEWDVAAGTLIATEAGAVVTDRAGRPARFNAPVPRVPGLIVAGPALHAALMARRNPA